MFGSGRLLSSQRPYLNGWPNDPTAFDNADSILLYMDGGNGHPVVQRSRLAELDELMKRGVGLCRAHYAVEVPKEKGGPDFLKWIGGYYETGYSINPHWVGDFKEIPRHPVTSGVKPFQIRDEWYYNIRFPEKQEGITPLLVAAPPDESRGTPAAKEHAGRPEVVAWVYERSGDGRGFGFTGALPQELGQRELPQAGVKRLALDCPCRCAGERSRVERHR